MPPTSPKNPTRLKESARPLSRITWGGDGGRVLLFCLGNGGDPGAFCGGFAGEAGSAAAAVGWLTALVKGALREGGAGAGGARM